MSISISVVSTSIAIKSDHSGIESFEERADEMVQNADKIRP